MPKPREYSAEFKCEAVEMVRPNDVSASQIAREPGINPNMLGRCCREAGKGGEPRDEEMAALKRELARVKKERNFLKEAAAFFSKASK